MAAAAAVDLGAAAPTTTSRAALSKLRVADLRALLAAAGVPASAAPRLKADLVEAAWAAGGGGGGGAVPGAGGAGAAQPEVVMSPAPPPPPRAAPAASIPTDPVPTRTGLAVTWLGTSSGAPTPARNVSSIAARTPGGAVLVDAGEGTAAQAAAAGIPPASIGAVLVTHLHGDHCFGLVGLLTAATAARAAAAAGGGGGVPPPPLIVAGPPGLGALVTAALRLPGGLDGGGSGFPARVLIAEFVTDPREAHPPRRVSGDGDDAGTAARLEAVRLSRRAPDRTPAAEAALRGRAAAAAAAAASTSGDEDAWEGYHRSHNSARRRGPPRRRPDQAAVHAVDVVPGLQWSLDLRALAGGDGGAPPAPPFTALPLAVVAAQLQHRVPCWGYALSEVVEEGEGQGPPPPRPPASPPPAPASPPLSPPPSVRPRKVVLLGDTCDSTAMTLPGAGADLLSHEATFAAGMAHKARIAQHSTAGMAGAFAAALDARALVLTHFSSRYATVHAGETGLMGGGRGGRGGRGPGSRSLGGGGGGGGGETAGDADAEVDAPPAAIRGLVAEARRAFGGGLVGSSGASPAGAMEGREVLAATDGFTVHVPRRHGGGAVKGEEKRK